MTTRRLPYAQAPFLNGPVGDASISLGAETTNTVTATVTVKDANGKAVSQRTALDWYLSTLATGEDVVGTAPNAGVVTGSAGAVHQQVTGKSGVVITNASGVANLVIGDSGAYTCYLVIRLPDGTLKVSDLVTLV